MGNRNDHRNDQMPNAQPASARAFFHHCHADLEGEFKTAFQDGIAQIVEASKRADHFAEVKTYDEVINTLRSTAQVAKKHICALMLGKIVDKSIEKKLNDSLDDEEVLPFHDDDMNRVTNDELEYQLKLEEAYSEACQHHKQLLLEAGMGATGIWAVDESPLRAELERLDPGRMALYVQTVFDKLYKKSHVSRIAFRFIGWRFYEGVVPLYQRWHPEIKKMVDELALCQIPLLKPQESRIENHDARTREIVSLLFKQIAENPALDPDVGFQISRAQMPVMTLAFSNSALFQAKDNPVRKYMNRLVDLGLKITSTEASGYLKMRELADKLLEQFQGDQAVFDDLNQALDQFMASDGAGYQDLSISDAVTNEQDAAPSKAVIEYLSREDEQIKRVLMFHRFANMVWAVLLSRIEQDKGVESPDWKEATHAYFEMLWSMQVDTSAEREAGAETEGLSGEGANSKRQVLRRIPKIVNSVRALFYKNGMSESVRESILNYMFRIHMQIIKGVSLMEIDDDFGRFLCGYEVAPMSNDLTKALLSGQEALNTAFDEVEKIKVGGRFELKREGVRHRCQLIHLCNVSGHYRFRVFGTQALLEVSKPDLVIDLLHGTLSKVSSDRLFDNCLASAITHVRSARIRG